MPAPQLGERNLLGASAVVPSIDSAVTEGRSSAGHGVEVGIDVGVAVLVRVAVCVRVAVGLAVDDACGRESGVTAPNAVAEPPIRATTIATSGQPKFLTTSS